MAARAVEPSAFFAIPMATPMQKSNGRPRSGSSSAPPAPAITFATSVHCKPSAPNTSGCPSRSRMPAAGSTAIGSCRLRPIFCSPWNRLFRQFGCAAALELLTLIGVLPDRPVLAAATLTAHWCRPVVGGLLLIVIIRQKPVMCLRRWANRALP